MSGGASLKWRTLIAVGGGAAVLGVALYYLRSSWSQTQHEQVSLHTHQEEAEEEDNQQDDEEEEEEKKKNSILTPATATKDDVLKVLVRIIESQEQMKLVMKDLVHLVLTKSLTFQQVYDHVKAVQPADPLEETRLSMQDFDQLLSTYQTDPEISTSIAKIMGMSNNTSEGCGKARDLTCDTIIDIHKFMVNEIKGLISEFRSLPDPSHYDMKTVTIAIQAMVGARVEKEYQVSSDELELAVVLQHDSLSMSPEFACINIEMQSTISSLMGNQFFDPMPSN